MGCGWGVNFRRSGSRVESYVRNATSSRGRRVGKQTLEAPVRIEVAFLQKNHEENLGVYPTGTRVEVPGEIYQK